MRGRQICILGAGIAGLAAALSCARRGAHVQVFEQAEAFADVGAGIQITPNGTRVLRRLGLGAALRSCALRNQAVILRDGYSGAAITRLDLSPYGEPQDDADAYYLLHRADVISLLGKAAEDAGVSVHFGVKATDVTLSQKRPEVRFEDGHVHESDVLIGADGINSRLRSALNTHDRPAFFTGQVAWRALIPEQACSAPPTAEVFVAPGRHLVSYPLRGGTMRNIVAVQERSAWAAARWSQRDDPAALRRAFTGFTPRVQTWLSQVSQPYLWGLFRQPLAQRWSARLSQGVAVIIGDAAHSTLPFLAQGANMAIEDALSLCAALEANDLETWQVARAARCARIIEAANSNARAYHLRGPARFISHNALRFGGAFAARVALRRFDWIYEYDAGTQIKAPSSP